MFVCVSLSLFSFVGVFFTRLTVASSVDEHILKS